MTLSRLRRIATSGATRLAGTALGVLLVLHSIDLHRAGSSLAAADVRWLVAGVAFSALVTLAGVLQWGVVLRHTQRFAWSQIGSWHLQSMFFAHIIPAGVGGDAMRCATVGREAGHGSTLATLAASRISGTLGMALWGVAGAILLHALLGPLVLVIAAVFAGLMALSWAGALAADLIHARMRRHAWLSRRDLVARMGSFTGGLGRLRRAPMVVVFSILAGATGWGLNLLALSFFAHALGSPAGWTVFAVALPVSLVATWAPFSINGIGLREGVLVGMLSHSGMTTTSAAAVSLIIDLQMVPFALIGATIWVTRRHRSARPAVTA